MSRTKDTSLGDLGALLDSLKLRMPMLTSEGLFEHALLRHDDELKRFVRRRLPLPVEYVRSCTSDAQRWCLAHCWAAESVTEMAAMIDVLTDLLERADTKRMSPDSGAARRDAALTDAAVAEA